LHHECQPKKLKRITTDRRDSAHKVLVTTILKSMRPLFLMLPKSPKDKKLTFLIIDTSLTSGDGKFPSPH